MTVLIIPGALLAFVVLVVAATWGASSYGRWRAGRDTAADNADSNVARWRTRQTAGGGKAK